jgi:histidinol phosphatase-like PHP family hydrolase
MQNTASNIVDKTYKHRSILVHEIIMKIDMHVHTLVSGDNDMTIHEAIRNARKKGLDGICITEHNQYEKSRHYEDIGKKEGFSVFVGCEYTSCNGHLLLYGLKDDSMISTKLRTMQSMIDYMASVGGVAVPAHPFRHIDEGELEFDIAAVGNLVYSLTGLVAIETMNGNFSLAEHLTAKAAAEKLGIKSTGGSDAHYFAHVGRRYTLFEERIMDTAGLANALRNGTYRAIDPREGLVADLNARVARILEKKIR